jgi:O-antigen/teichoic acid export membrane protein
VAIATLLFPRLSSMRHVEEKLELTKRVVLTSGVAFGCMLLAGSLLASPMVRIMFGDRFVAAGTAFVWLAPGLFFLGMETVAVQFLNSAGYPTSVVWAWLAATILKLPVSYVAIQRYGIVGACFASTVTYALLTALVFGIIQLGYGRRGRERIACAEEAAST